MTINLSNLILSPPVFLAPMAGTTDRPSREIAQLFNTGLVVSEMIASSEQNIIALKKTVEKNLFGKKQDSAPTSIQIAGNEPTPMSTAAKIIEDEGGDIVDINMGCPAKKVVGQLAGSALMKDPQSAIQIIQAVVNATNLPVTLKMRLGWDENLLSAGEIAVAAEKLGIQMLTIHARTRNQFFNGKADWKSVKRIKKLVNIPVIINGDICDTKTAKDALSQSNADGVMIGRGALGKPWVFNDIAAEIFGFKTAKKLPVKDFPALIIYHLKKIVLFYGEKDGVRIFRKHLSAYLKNFGYSNENIKKIVTDDSYKSVCNKIINLFNYGRL